MRPKQHSDCERHAYHRDKKFDKEIRKNDRSRQPEPPYQRRGNLRLGV